MFPRVSVMHLMSTYRGVHFLAFLSLLLLSAVFGVVEDFVFVAAAFFASFSSSKSIFETTIR